MFDFVIVEIMGKAGQALRQVLDTHNISQSLLARELGVEHPIVFRWFHEHTDPTAETVFETALLSYRFMEIAATGHVGIHCSQTMQRDRVNVRR